MNTAEKIQNLQNAHIEYTDIASVIYETSKNFDSDAEEIRFYRVVCHTSYEAGSFVRTEIWLPEDWNGRFIGLGNGGMAGDFWYSDLLKHTRRGYAAAQTDLGTSLGMESGIHNPAVWKDFGWRSTHGMTEIGKEIVALHYGKKPEYSYFWGISTGGQQAMSEAQRFPHDYDGIIAGVPANNRIALHTYFLWTFVQLTAPDGNSLLSDEEIRRLTDSAVKYFHLKFCHSEFCHSEYFPQEAPSCGDNFISYPWKDSNTIDSFLQFLKDKNFSEAQLHALKAIYEGPVSPASGKQIYNGIPMGSEANNIGLHDMQDPQNPNFYPFFWALGADLDLYSFDFDKDYAAVRAALSADMDANDPDLRPLKEKGGKFIAFSGSADPCVPYPDAQKYYERVMAKMGGYEETASFFRYFLFPGKDHVSGGAGSNQEWGSTDGSLDLLDVIRMWCEEGKAPEFLIAARVKPEHLEDKTLNQENILFAREIYPYGSEKNPLKECTKVCEIFE